MTTSPNMTVKQAAAYWNRSVNAVRIAMCRRADWLPPVYTSGSRVYFKTEDVIASVKKRPY